MWIGFLYTGIDMAESGLGEHLVSKNGVLSSFSGVFMVNLMWQSTEFK